MRPALPIITVLLAIVLISSAARAQSTDQNFPTHVTSNDLNGSIRARDVGDPRLTSHYYLFEGLQGDLFVNVVAQNLSGDIDVFAADGLRPLAKMVFYADAGQTETGRLIYLRKGERLLLRVQGRSPNDDPATYRIRFGGSFAALPGAKDEGSPTVARTVEAPDEVRVNSVGTILPSPPKPAPIKKPAEPPRETTATTRPPEKKEPVSTPPKVVVTDRTPPAKGTAPRRENPPTAKNTDRTAPPRSKSKSEASAKATVPAKPKAKPDPTTAAVPPASQPTMPPPDPLASIRLVVRFKNGLVLERPMNEVERFGVVDGVLTVALKNGRTNRYPILDVAELTVR